MLLHINKFTSKFKTLPLFFSKLYTQIKNCTHKMQNASHLLQNEALHSKYHKYISKANICKRLCIILIPVRFLCYIENCVLLFCKKCFMKLKTESKAENECMVLQIWCVVLVVWVSGFRNCVTSKDFVWKQLKKNCNKNPINVPLIINNNQALNQHITLN